MSTDGDWQESMCTIACSGCVSIAIIVDRNRLCNPSIDSHGPSHDTSCKLYIDRRRPPKSQSAVLSHPGQFMENGYSITAKTVEHGAMDGSIVARNISPMDTFHNNIMWSTKTPSMDRLRILFRTDSKIAPPLKRAISFFNELFMASRHGQGCSEK